MKNKFTCLIIFIQQLICAGHCPRDPVVRETEDQMHTVIPI